MVVLTTNASYPIMLKEIQLQLSLDVCFGALQGMSEKEVNDLISYTICAQGIFSLWQGVCNGDSGSPLMKVKEGRYELVGIAFWKYTCTRYPAYYTRVSIIKVSYLDPSKFEKLWSSVYKISQKVF